MTNKRKRMSPAEASPLIQKQPDDAGSDGSSEDSEAEQMHFDLRLDPAEDISDDDVEDIQSAPAKKSQTLTWKSERDADISPPPLRFHPNREPGVQLRAGDNHTPLDLFKLFFSKDAVETLCRNTNKQAARNIAGGAKYRWVDVGVDEFYRFLGLVFYMGVLKLSHVTDYWRRNNIFTVLFPAQVMARDRYRTIFWNVHVSDPDKDRENDAKKGTSAHDKLFRVQPLMNTIQNACKAFYHPRRNLSVDERMVASMKNKPTKRGFKLFVLADSSNGYTLDFSVYTGKNNFPTSHGLSYDSVMSLIDKGYLGSGYHVYMDSFYTSPKLFKDLHAAKFGACGAYRESRRGCPRGGANALTKHSSRGTIRWIRDGPAVYVKWMNTREVSVCSTIHAAYDGGVVQQRAKTRRGVGSTQSVPCPEPVVEYNKYMGGVALSDQLIQYFTTQHKTMKWYKKLFLHFLDIAATNAFILHKELQQKKSMSHKHFMEELTAQLCGISLTFQPPKTHVKTTGEAHMPVCEAELSTERRMAGDGRGVCVYCRRQGRKTKAQWKCGACGVYLCLQPDRNCYAAWHQDENC